MEELTDVVHQSRVFTFERLCVFACQDAFTGCGDPFEPSPFVSVHPEGLRAGEAP
jgi:hypothetical protein